MLIEDLYDEHYLSLGTWVTLSLNKINSYDSYQNNLLLMMKKMAKQVLIDKSRSIVWEIIGEGE